MVVNLLMLVVTEVLVEAVEQSLKQVAQARKVLTVEQEITTQLVAVVEEPREQAVTL